MQISVDQLRAEAGDLALENRLMDKVIGAQQAQIAALEQKIAELENPEDGDGAADENPSED
jgi:hypothetical protein